MSEKKSDFRKPCSSFFPRLLSHWPILTVLLTGLASRLFLYLNITPRLHTDSVTYLILEDLWTIRTPGYPQFIEIIQFFNDLFSLTSDYLGLILFLQIFILGLLNVGLIYVLARKLTGSTVFAVCVGILYNVNYFVLGFELLVLTETLAITLLLLTLFFYLKIYETSWKHAWVAGLCSAFLLLTRPVFQVFFFVLVGITILLHLRKKERNPFFKKFGKAIVIFLVFNLVGILSWSLRNKIKFDYFGMSTIMPYQLYHHTQHFFHKYKFGEDPEVDCYAEIFKEVDGNDSQFNDRLAREFDMNPVQISQAFLKLNLKLIKDNPVDYLKQIPPASTQYYLTYSPYWTTYYNNKLLTGPGIFPKIYLSVFQVFQKLYSSVWLLVLLVLLLPVLLLFLVKKDRPVFHLFLILEAAIHYNFLISVLSTNAGVNNVRYRVPVEPLIILVYLAALFLLARSIFKRFVKTA